MIDFKQSTVHDIEALVKDGTCPFTGDRYRCGMCDSVPKCVDPPCSMHFCMYIASPLAEGDRGWRRTLAFFDKEDREEVRPVLERLLKSGVENLPIGCDSDHFCFKIGCIGHDKEGAEKNKEKKSQPVQE